MPNEATESLTRAKPITASIADYPRIYQEGLVLNPRVVWNAPAEVGLMLTPSYADSFDIVQNTAYSFLSGTFRSLAAQWKEESRYSSSFTAMESHEAYRSIIDLGPTMIPFLLAELVREPNWWFMALEALAEDPPSFEGLEGDLAGIAQAWLDWGRIHGYLPGN